MKKFLKEAFLVTSLATVVILAMGGMIHEIKNIDIYIPEFLIYQDDATKEDVIIPAKESGSALLRRMLLEEPYQERSTDNEPSHAEK